MDRLFTIRTAADMLAVSDEHLRRLHKKGHLKMIRVGTRGIRVPESEIDRLSREGVGVTPHGAGQ